jgi:hypothetical protein
MTSADESAYSHSVPSARCRFVGDVIVAINRLATRNMTHTELKQHIVDKDICELQVHRIAAQEETAELVPVAPSKATEAEVAIEIVRADNGRTERQAASEHEVLISRNNLTTSFGFALGSVGEAPAATYQSVASVKPGGPADGKLQKRDIIMMINGSPVPREHDDVITLISGSTALKIGILRPLRPEPLEEKITVSSFTLVYSQRCALTRFVADPRTIPSHPDPHRR